MILSSSFFIELESGVKLFEIPSDLIRLQSIPSKEVPVIQPSAIYSI